MKKLFLLVFTLALLFLSACEGDVRDVPAPLNPLEEKATEKVLAQTANFEIKAIEKDGHTKYSYTVTANDGTVMETALCAEEPIVAAIGDNLIGIRFTQDDHEFSRYFDYVNKRVSASFRDAFWDNGKLVAYHGYENGHIFVVRDIFDDAGFFEKTPVDCNSWQLTVYDVQEQTGSISVRFYMGISESSNNGLGSALLTIPGEG